MLAAIRTRRPNAVIDWMGSILDMKDGCRLSKHRGGSEGGLGRDLHFHAMGSKQKKPTECDWQLPEGLVVIGEVRARRA